MADANNYRVVSRLPLRLYQHGVSLPLPKEAHLTGLCLLNAPLSNSSMTRASMRGLRDTYSLHSILRCADHPFLSHLHRPSPPLIPTQQRLQHPVSTVVS